MNAHRLARLGAVILVTASTAALTGCSFDPFKGEAPAAPTVNLVRAGRPLTQAETKLAVPIGAAAPSGYAVEPSNMLQPKRPGAYSVRPALCDALYRGIDIDYVKASAKTYLTYVNSDKTHLGVGVGSRSGSPGGVAKASAALAGCKKFVVKEGKDTISMTTAPLSLPKMGEASIAVRYTVRFPKVKQAATYDAVRILAGHNTILVDALSTTEILPIPGELEGAADSVLLTLSR